MGWVGLLPRRIAAVFPAFLDMGRWEGELVEGMVCLGPLALFLPCCLHFLNLALILGWLHSRECLGEHSPPPMNLSGFLFQLECLLGNILCHLICFLGLQVL